MIGLLRPHKEADGVSFAGEVGGTVPVPAYSSLSDLWLRGLLFLGVPFFANQNLCEKTIILSPSGAHVFGVGAKGRVTAIGPAARLGRGAVNRRKTYYRERPRGRPAAPLHSLCKQVLRVSVGLL